MLLRDLRRVIWGAASAVVAAAALVAIVAIVTGDFDEGDGKILATLGLVLLGGLTLLTGLAVVERGVGRPFGWAVAAFAPVFFLIETTWIWRGFEDDTLGTWAATAFVLVPVALVAATSRLLLRNPRLLPIFAFECVALVLAGGLTIWAIWSEDTGDAAAQLIAVLWVLAALGWAVVPLLQRAGGTRHGDDGAGSAQVKRVPVRKVAPGETAVFLRGSRLVLVVAGKEQTLGADEAVVIRR
jgi:hypothetical protein